MYRTQQKPTVQYCIEGTLPGGNIAVERFTIEQAVPQGNREREANLNYNTVQRTIHDLGLRTGLDYRIVRWGDVQDRSRWIAGAVFND